MDHLVMLRLEAGIDGIDVGKGFIGAGLVLFGARTVKGVPKFLEFRVVGLVPGIMGDEERGHHFANAGFFGFVFKFQSIEDLLEMLFERGFLLIVGSFWRGRGGIGLRRAIHLSRRQYSGEKENRRDEFHNNYAVRVPETINVEGMRLKMENMFFLPNAGKLASNPQ